MKNKQKDIISQNLNQPTLSVKKKFIQSNFKNINWICWDIYVIKNTVNSKKYIGQTVKGMIKRFKSHLRKDNLCKHLGSAINKYGKDKFYPELLKKCYNKNDADYWEDYYIVLFNTIENGYNLMRGGRGNLMTCRDKEKRSGENNYQAATTFKIAEEIRKLNDTTDMTQKEIAKKFNLSISAVNRIARNKCYKNSDYEPISKHNSGMFKIGENSGDNSLFSKITQKEVDYARNLYLTTDIRIRELATKFNTSYHNMNDIINNKSWKDNNYIPIKKSVIYNKNPENRSNAIFTWEDIHYIRKNKDNLTQDELAKKYNTHKSYISTIVRNKNWYDPSYRPPPA